MGWAIGNKPTEFFDVNTDEIYKSGDKQDKQFDDVQNPQHYTDSKIEVIDYIEDKNLGFCLGNVIKYVSRAGRKHSVDKTDKEKTIEDLKKAKWYLDRRIKELEKDLCD